MCREGAWAELTVKVTSGSGVQSRMLGLKKGDNIMSEENKVMEEEVMYMTLTFDDGVEEDCEILGVFEEGGKEYIALLSPEGDAYIYGYHALSDEEFELLDIETEEEFDRAAAKYDEIMDAKEA